MWFFVTFFIVFGHFKTTLQTQWLNWMIFSFTNVFLCWFWITLQLIFFHLSRLRVQISPPNVFLGNFSIFFPTLKYYNLSIYEVKWPQIWFMSSLACRLQYCMVEIFIPYWHLDLYHLKSKDAFRHV